MKIEQIYTGCLAQGAYYITSNGEAAIIDPLRETKPYTDRLEKDNVKLKYIFETHFHADFVSGHLDLSKQTGASIVYGPNAMPDFEFISAKDTQEFSIGNIKIKVLHTPGHTMESTTYLLIDENGKDHAIFSGDTLFIGDVGRPDLAQKSASMTQNQLAATLFHSLRTKLMTLADDVIVYPAHGAGSACGKNMSKETTDTLGNQKKTNYALRADMTREEFVTELLDGLGAPPAYFPQNVLMNIQGYSSLDDVMKKSLKALSPDEFEEMANQTEALILDVRYEGDFVKGHIPNAIFIGIQGGFAPWVGALIRDVKQPLLLITPEGKEEETITRLSRVGFDGVLGFLKGGFNSWKESGKEIATIKSISPMQFAEEFNTTSIVIDARKPSEFTAERVENAINIPLDNVNERFKELPKETFYLHCAGGYRSVIMASILKSRGLHNLINIEKGISGIRETNVPLTKFICPSTLI